jgi:hypothetical protein
VDVITRYCEAVETLQRAQEPWPEEQLLICLVARDAISHSLKAGKLHDVALMRQLFAADRALRILLLRLATVATIRTGAKACNRPLIPGGGFRLRPQLHACRID